MAKDRVFQLCDIVRETGFAIHQYLGGGHLEKIYERALAHRLQIQSIPFAIQVPLTVRDQDGFLLCEFVADMVIDQLLIVEVKAVRALADEHVAQLLGYLRASGIEHGILVNFGAGRFQVRKFVWSRGRQWAEDAPSGADESASGLLQN